LVSHDRDFIDRVASMTVAMEGDGKATVYAGGWSDYQDQRGERIVQDIDKRVEKPKSPGGAKAATDAAAGLSFTEKHRLEALPGIMEKLEAEIAKLVTFMSDPDLFTKEPAKFQKATDALVERQAALDAAEEEWMMLEEKASA